MTTTARPDWAQGDRPPMERFYVRIDRVGDDGSRTYKGPMSPRRAKREARAWRESFPSYLVALVPVREGAADVRAWAKATKVSQRYWPAEAERATG